MKGSAPTRVACRELSPALARLCSLALWLLRFEKTIVNRFFLLALAGPPRSSSNSVIHIKKQDRHEVCLVFLAEGVVRKLNRIK